MTILFAPSESKRGGGNISFDLEKLLFSDIIADLRRTLLERYRQLLREGDRWKLSAVFGFKRELDIAFYATLDPLKTPALKAVKRYCGVAYRYLNYASLTSEAQNYIDDNLLIFSNLFGPLRAYDHIPDYRLTQGAALGGIYPEKLYRESTSRELDKYLEGKDVLDLRAVYYNRFYKPSVKYTIPKFVKKGRVLSYWAKAYRGIVLREIALAGAKSLDEFMALPIPGLSLIEIHNKKNIREIIYEIEEM